MVAISLRLIEHYITGKESLLKQDISVNGICADSRLLNAGEVFFALPGAKVDGHQFLKQVSEQGALAAVVLTTYEGSDYGLTLIRVNDVLKALQVLARKVLEARKPRVIAVTGSVGKTTTKDFLTTILREKFKVASSPGNSNSQVGLPLAILNHTTGDEDILILEMGMTESGQISKLIEIAPPHIALLTTVEYAHACNFKSIDDIARSKAEIFLSPKTTLGILPTGIPIFDEVRKSGSCPKETFTTGIHGADYNLQETLRGITVKAENQSINLPHLSVPGKHNLHNLCAAIAVARSLHMEWEEIARVIPKLELPERRLQSIEKNGVLFINDSYNAIPVAVKAALKSLPAPKAGCKRIAVIGDMMELGELTERMHSEVAQVALENVDHMLCFGIHCKPIQEIWSKANKPVSLHTDLDELVAELKKQMKPGDVVLLKGSRSKGLWRVLEAIGSSK